MANGRPDKILKNPNGEMGASALKSELSDLGVFLALPQSRAEQTQTKRGMLSGFGGLFSGKGKTVASTPASTPVSQKPI